VCQFVTLRSSSPIFFVASKLAPVPAHHRRRFAARMSGRAFGLALAVRPAGLAEAPALKGGS
jgi:hypothetical protein